MKLNIKHGAYSIFFCQIDNINFSCLCALKSKSRWEVGVKKGDESYFYFYTGTFTRVQWNLFNAMPMIQTLSLHSISGPLHETSAFGVLMSRSYIYYLKIVVLYEIYKYCHWTVGSVFLINVIMFVSDFAAGWWFSPGTPAFHKSLTNFIT